MWYFIQQILKPYKIELTGWLWGGGYLIPLYTLYFSLYLTRRGCLT